MPRIEFDSEKAEPKEAIVVSFDLSGFSTFCNHPNAHVVIPRFISTLFGELNRLFMDGFQEFFTSDKSGDGKLKEPDFVKYMGDGALMIWLADSQSEFSEQFCTDLVVAMRGLQTQIAKIVSEWEKTWRVRNLPKHARFGISTGLVYALRQPRVLFEKEPCDYVGYCINLAVRLQDHSTGAGFLVHEILHPNVPGLIKLGDLEMKGTQVEPVLAFEADVKNVTKKNVRP